MFFSPRLFTLPTAVVAKRFTCGCRLFFARLLVPELRRSGRGKKTNHHEGPPSFGCLWLILIAIHFDRPKQMRERELGELPLAVFLDINLSHHKRIGDFVLTDCCLQINVL